MRSAQTRDTATRSAGSQVSFREVNSRARSLPATVRHRTAAVAALRNARNPPPIPHSVQRGQHRGDDLSHDCQARAHVADHTRQIAAVRRMVNIHGRIDRS